ncbi:hypothetical protein J2S11_001590 [Bacillus horti]|uniref:Uncharacterized protein n=1 Tax=Caldalkalibacillus horti TaxID=77523 RepID=A0ABT9VXJ1_9BACI|nr:hypothetical protein [Bacillus horti]
MQTVETRTLFFVSSQVPKGMANNIAPSCWERATRAVIKGELVKAKVIKGITSSLNLSFNIEKKLKNHIEVKFLLINITTNTFYE